MIKINKNKQKKLISKKKHQWPVAIDGVWWEGGEVLSQLMILEVTFDGN